MIEVIKTAYVAAFRFVRAFPAIVAVVVAAEFAQHVAEITLGIYDSLDRARAMADAPLRLAFGHLKVVALLLLGYTVARFIGLRDDPHGATRLDRRAVTLFAGVLLFGLAGVVIGLDGGAVLRGVGAGDAAVRWLVGGLVAVMTVLGMLTIPWRIAAPLGNPAIGFVRAIAMSWRRLPWVFAMVIITTLPVIALHYALFYGVVGRGAALVWPVAFVDSLVVGYLGVLLVAVDYGIASRLADRAGVSLLPGEDRGHFG